MKYHDRIVMRLQPDPHLDIRIDMKQPGLETEVELVSLQHRYPDG